MLSGLLNLPWWGDLLAMLVLVQITIAAVTIYLHRCQAHRALDLHPVVSHFFRFWLWLTTGMVTKTWTAIHRKHHARCETEEDPHSPQISGISKVLWEGAELYRREALNPETLKKYGRGTPDDWIERKLYARHEIVGIASLFAINFVLFGFIGIAVWAVQLGSLIEVVNRFGSFFYGSILGVFVLAVGFRRATGNGAFAGVPLHVGTCAVGVIGIPNSDASRRSASDTCACRCTASASRLRRRS